VGIGALVKLCVDRPRPVTVYGIVVDGAAWTDVESVLHDYIGMEGQPAPEFPIPTERPEIRVYTAAVLRHEPEEPLQPVPGGPVYLAGDEDVRVALRMDAYAKPGGTGIAVGLYTAGGLQAPVYLDADFLLGPEAAHLNITGVSGLATKTSAVLFLLASIFEYFGRTGASVEGLRARGSGLGELRAAPGPAAPGHRAQGSGLRELRAASDAQPLSPEPQALSPDAEPQALSPDSPTVAALCFNV